MASAKSNKKTKRSTPIYSREFRYRSNGNETNRKVLVTAQNQNSLRGFDVSEMTPRQISALEKTWDKVAGLDIPLSEKESRTISSSRNAKSAFRYFKQSRVRYFLKNS